MSMRLKLITISMLLLLICLSVSAADDIDIQVALDRDTIGMDEQATLQIIVSGNTQNLPDLDMPTLSMFDIRSQGRSSNFRYENGVISSSLTYRYLLLPNKPGTFPIQQISVVYNNKRYKGNNVELTVLSQGSTVSRDVEDKAQTTEGKSKDYFMEAVVDNRNPYVNEQITLTLKFYIAVQYYGSPELTEPTTTGFWTEILGNKAPYFQTIQNRRYKIIERKYALFPTQTGDLEIGRAMIRVTVPSKSRRGTNDLFGNFFGRGEDVSVRSNLVRIKVKPLPDEGRPADFSGTIGKFNITASVSKNKTEVNQPVSVTVKISGTGNIKSVAEPAIPEMEDKFRIYRASTSENVSKLNERIGGTKIFEEVFIPKRPGEIEIPAISYNYFDPKSEKYRRVATNSITLQVTKPEGYVASNEVPFASPDFTISSTARDIRYIKEDIGDTEEIGYIIIKNPFYLIVNVLPVFVFVGLVVVRIRKEKFAGDIGYARSKAALKEAKKRLAKAKSIADVDTTTDFYLEVYTALTAFIADKLNISPHGLTSDGVKEMLDQKQVDQTMIADILAIMQRSDFARYASSTLHQEDINRDLAKAEDLMVRMAGVNFD